MSSVKSRVDFTELNFTVLTELHIVLNCSPLYGNLLHYKTLNLTVLQTAVWLTPPLNSHVQGSNRQTDVAITGGKHASVAMRNTEGTRFFKGR